MKPDIASLRAPSLTMRCAHCALLIISLLSVGSLIAQDTAAPPKSDTTARQDGTAKQDAAAKQPGLTTAPSAPATAPDPTVAYWFAFGVCTALLLAGAFAMTTALKRDPNWSLAAALSEESSPIVPPKQADAGGAASAAQPAAPVAQPPAVVAVGAGAAVAAAVVPAQPSADQTPEPRLVGSASRLIAAFGLMVLAAMILGIGYGIMWSLFTKSEIPNLSGLGPYLLGGAALFAPYAFNQIKEAFNP